MPTSFPDDLSQQQLDCLFPVRRPLIRPDVFEIGLVLGGTVSAGAYTAGVLDYLVEALDAWTRAKEQGDPYVPTHEVIVSTIAGASGGGIYGGVFARAMGWSFEHGTSEKNPFFQVAMGVDLVDLLSPGPEHGLSGLASLLNCSALDEQTARSIEYEGGKLGDLETPRQRSYLADPLRLFVMVGNLAGLPYTIRLAGGSKLTHDLIEHVDFMRFGLRVDGGPPNLPATREDEIPLSSYSSGNWDLLRAAVLASSAFPAAFRSRPLQRSLAACGYRVTLVPGEAGNPRVAQLIPRWDVLSAGEPNESIVNFAAVDGGTFNNQPLDIVRTALAGLNGRNKRGGEAADRAVILIDPFSDPVPLGPRQPPGALGLLRPFLTALIYQSRFKPEDIALAEEPDVYSRFLIAPYGPGGGDTPISGKGAIASGGLGGFLGFVDRKFLDYDYQLGRRNAYEFLRRDFVFPEGNRIFVCKWNDAQKQDQRRDLQQSGVIPVKPGYLPMIPLVQRLRENPPPPMTKENWPRLDDIPANLSPAIEGRLQAVYDLLMAEHRPSSCWKSLAISLGLGVPWNVFLRRTLRDKALDEIQSALRDQRLLKSR